MVICGLPVILSRCLERVVAAARGIRVTAILWGMASLLLLRPVECLIQGLSLRDFARRHDKAGALIDELGELVNLPIPLN